MAMTHPPNLTPEQRADFEERAAIMEFDGNLPRAEAERLALLLALKASGISRVQR